MDKKFIEQRIKDKRFKVTTHALERRLERGITLKEMQRILIEGKIIEVDKKAKPYPTTIVLGYTKHGDPIHVVLSEAGKEPKLRIFTVYDPDSALWDKTFSKRKK